jgi:glycosyltransferase involved in cell wall biosynthesis
MPDVVLPCLDEARALPWVLDRMPPGYRPIVADNDSTDGSAEVAAAHGARVVQARPRGFGAACHTGLLIHDLGPMRACRREALLELDLQDRRFGYPLEMVTRAVAAGWRVVEVDVDYLPRTGRSKVTGTVGGTIKAVQDMSRVLREVA